MLFGWLVEPTYGIGFSIAACKIPFLEMCSPRRVHSDGAGYYTGWLLCFRNVRLSAQCLFLLITFIGINSVAWPTTSSGTDGRSEPIGMIVIYTSREDGVMRVMVIRMAVTWKVLSVPFAQVKGKTCILVVFLLKIGECVGSCVLNVINYLRVLDKITSMSAYMIFSSL